MIVEILHVRDPDSECYLSVFIDGEKVEFSQADVDAGRGYTAEDWKEHSAWVNRNEHYSDAFKAAILEARADPPGSKFIDGDLDEDEDDLAEAAHAWFSVNATGSAAQEEQAIKGAILLLALAAREQFPEAHAVLLEDSDQGPYLTVMGVVDKDGNNIDPDWQFDDEGYASWLSDSMTSFYEEFVPMTRTTRNNPQWTLTIDDVLAKIKPPS